MGPYGVSSKNMWDYHNPLHLSPGAVGSGEEAIEEREVEKRRKRFAAELWPFLYVLANHFATMDLSRPCVYGDC